MGRENCVLACSDCQYAIKVANRTYQCGYTDPNKRWLKCIEDIRAEITKKHLKKVELDAFHTGYCVALEEVLSLIDRKVNELRGGDAE